MRKHVFAHLAKPEDGEECAKWLTGTKGNEFDPAVITYPASRTFKASNGRNLIFMPIQTVFMLESLAINPENSLLETASALKSLIQAARWEAEKLGHGEMYFLCSEPSTQQFAEANGFERMTAKQCSCGEAGMVLYRMRLLNETLPNC